MDTLIMIGRVISDWLHAMAEKHYTAVGVVICGLIALGCGLALLIDPPRALGGASTRVMFHLAPPHVWGAVWIVLCIVLLVIAIRSISNQSILKKAWVSVSLLGLSYAVVAACMGLAVNRGQGTPLAVAITSGLSAIIYFVALGTYFAGRRT